MKKFRFLLSIIAIVAIFGLLNNASALQFDLDLTPIDPDYGTYNDIFRINVDGFANVNQSFGADNVFNDGDIFTETTILQEISYKNSLGGSNKFFLDLAAEGKYMYLYGENITGYVDNVSATNPMDFSTYTFDYIFNPNSGSIGMYIDTDSGSLSHNAGTAELVASFSLFSGDGAGEDGFLGGIENAGTTRMTGEFLAATPDNVWLAAGLDLGNLPPGFAAFAQLNTTNQVIEFELYGYFDQDLQAFIAQGFNSVINSTGHMTVNVVPEPTTMLLLGLGLIGIAAVSKKRTRVNKK